MQGGSRAVPLAALGVGDAAVRLAAEPRGVSAGCQRAERSERLLLLLLLRLLLAGVCEGWCMRVARGKSSRRSRARARAHLLTMKRGLLVERRPGRGEGFCEEAMPGARDAKGSGPPLAGPRGADARGTCARRDVGDVGADPCGARRRGRRRARDPRALELRERRVRCERIAGRARLVRALEGRGVLRDAEEDGDGDEDED